MEASTKKQTFLKVVLCCSLVAVAILSAQVQAQPPQGRRGGAFGDWKVKVDYGGRSFDSILSFSRDQEGNRTAQWISFMGATDLKDVSYEDGKVDFLLSMQFGDQSFEMTFAGKLADSKLTGELTSSRGSQKITGTKIVRTFRRRTQ